MKRSFLIALFAVSLIAAAMVAGAQTLPFHPSPGELINSQQIHALRAEVMQLRVMLIACQEDLEKAKKALELCEKGTKALEEAEKAEPE
jgi:hypothetical protein